MSFFNLTSFPLQPQKLVLYLPNIHDSWTRYKRVRYKHVQRETWYLLQTIVYKLGQNNCVCIQSSERVQLGPSYPWIILFSYFRSPVRVSLTGSTWWWAGFSHCFAALLEIGKAIVIYEIRQKKTRFNVHSLRHRTVLDKLHDREHTGLYTKTVNLV